MPTKVIKVISQAEAENVDMVACVLAGGPEYFTDNVHTTCGMCGRAIVHRPHAPVKPMKVCMECVMARTAGKLN